jgi:catechol-2,3-dioxygenase
MKRIHIMLNTANLQSSKTFYSALLGTKPTKEKTDYIQWKLDNPALNLSLMSKPVEEYGDNHLGIETNQQGELDQLFKQVAETDNAYEEGETTCCYAKSQKSWAKDPEGIEWEMFHTHESSPTYHGEPADDH